MAGFLDWARTNIVLTFLSRIVGLARDVAAAGVFGLHAQGVMDSFTVAFRVPNVFRGLFGEGALSAAFIPEMNNQLENHGKEAAWRFASVVLSSLALLTLGITLVGELVCAGLWWRSSGQAATGQVLGLTALLLPYVILVCLWAQVMALLNTLKHFAFPALGPTLMNVAMLLGVAVVGPAVSDDPRTQILVVAGAVLVGGALQLGVQIIPLRRLGFRFRFVLDWAHPGLHRVMRMMAPMMLGLAVVQINVLMDALIAWGLSSPGGSADTFHLLGWDIAYPMRQGAAASLYFGTRMYQFPLGVFGVALASAMYPLLSRYVARNQPEQVPIAMAKGLRVAMFVGVPATVGLVVLGEPITRVFLGWGKFTDDDVLRTSLVVACYATGVWAYCCNRIVVHGFYALSDPRTPVRIGAGVVGLNLAMNLTLIWFMAEAGLALATAISAMVRFPLLLWAFRRRTGDGQAMRQVGWTALKALAASVLMGATAWAGWHYVGVHLLGDGGFVDRVLAMGVSVGAGVVAYALAAVLLRMTELRELLLSRRSRSAVEE